VLLLENNAGSGLTTPGTPPQLASPLVISTLAIMEAPYARKGSYRRAFQCGSSSRSQPRQPSSLMGLVLLDLLIAPPPSWRAAGQRGAFGPLAEAICTGGGGAVGPGMHGPPPRRARCQRGRGRSVSDERHIAGPN
jgi:hypothetical protein